MRKIKFTKRKAMLAKKWLSSKEGKKKLERALRESAKLSEQFRKASKVTPEMLRRISDTPYCTGD